jgi:hypothetical protein
MADRRVCVPGHMLWKRARSQPIMVGRKSRRAAGIEKPLKPNAPDTDLLPVLGVDPDGDRAVIDQL